MINKIHTIQPLIGTAIPENNKTLVHTIGETKAEKHSRSQWKKIKTITVDSKTFRYWVTLKTGKTSTKYFVPTWASTKKRDRKTAFVSIKFITLDGGLSWFSNTDSAILQSARKKKNEESFKLTDQQLQWVLEWDGPLTPKELLEAKFTGFNF